METFARLESEVRSYCRSWPAVFDQARGSWLVSEAGDRYLDLFAGAGALNYGHNPPAVMDALRDHLAGDGIVHSLDMATPAKRTFLERFHELILAPRGMDHKVMFPGPTGTNAVEAALKIARKATGREIVVSFTNAFHGMTLGSLAVSGDEMKRQGAQVPLGHTHRLPYAGYLGDGTETLDLFERQLEDAGSGVGLPAAVIVETVQGEGGLRHASAAWLRRLAELCQRHDIVLIVDDIQAGCGRTGTFFSFEPAGIVPDVVTLSKSLSGGGLPFAVTLIRPELDVWQPGEHNGTFRGFNPAFVTATAALEAFWADDTFAREVQRKAGRLEQLLQEVVEAVPGARAEVVGRGLMIGLSCEVPGLAARAAEEAFARGVLLETSGAEDQVVKLLPPLSISDEDLDTGVRTIREALEAALTALPEARDAEHDLVSA
ncbi:diaminobutyrate--2-oxoglutarate transaminase [Nitriliruptoraceae bacterium ZYF776]|nr:diaminobutyrate--2-oxoglutarate transaminase [Profundirhabdus halotolerans]